MTTTATVNAEIKARLEHIGSRLIDASQCGNVRMNRWHRQEAREMGDELFDIASVLNGGHSSDPLLYLEATYTGKMMQVS